MERWHPGHSKRWYLGEGVEIFGIALPDSICPFIFKMQEGYPI